ncbi:MAG: hypothetical protein KJP21_05530 [Bacteroidia bacterium]|nr:hypothetical protein [Bacteroidia bacterium]NNJ55579.1 hypothetical protein [Bacteroidia bacterium]
MFKYIIIGILGYWIIKRVFRISAAVNQEKQTQSPKETKEDRHGGDYVDFEEID